MPSTVRSLLFGQRRGRDAIQTLLLAALGLFAASFAAYAVDLFAVSGGLVWIPFHGALVGMAAAGVVGYLRGGLAFAWLMAYAGVLGYHADHAFIGLPRRSFAEQLTYFLRPDGLAFLGVQALVLGSLAFTVGALLSAVLGLVRTRRVDTA